MLRTCARLTALALLLSIGPVGLVGCDGDTEGRVEGEGDETVEYTVRGEVVSLPTDLMELQVRHEAIPEYRASDGSLGMNTMIMPFPLAEGVSLEGMDVGDKIELTFAVTYVDGAVRGYRMTRWDELPPETELDFSPLPPDEPEGADGAAE